MTCNLHAHIHFTSSTQRFTDFAWFTFSAVSKNRGTTKERSSGVGKVTANFGWLFAQKPQKKGITGEEDSALPHRNFKSVAKENTFLKSCIIRGSLNSRIMCSKIVLEKYFVDRIVKRKMDRIKSQESKNFKMRWENWSNRMFITLER